MSSYTLSQLETISGLIQRDTIIWLTAQNWGRLAAELDPETLTDKGTKPTPQNFKRLNLRAKNILTAVNSGSDDEAALDLLNRMSEEYSDFIGARNRFAVRKGTKKDALEFVDAESTHAMPEDLYNEALHRWELTRK